MDQAREAAERKISRRQAEHDALVVPRIRALREEGCGWGTIADVLGLDGLPTPRPGGTWSATAVRRIARRHGLVVDRRDLDVGLTKEHAWALIDLISETLEHMDVPPTAAVHHGERLLGVRAILRRALQAEARS